MILEKLEHIFREILADDELQLTMETCPDNISEWDSYTQILLIDEIEKEFAIKINMDDVFKIRTVGDFVEVIERLTR